MAPINCIFAISTFLVDFPTNLSFRETLYLQLRTQQKKNQPNLLVPPFGYEIGRLLKVYAYNICIKVIN